VTAKGKNPAAVGANQRRLELRYVPLDTVKRWDQNPKKHDLPALQESIKRYGFGDPPAFDSNLQALVYGNGRAEAVEKIQAAGEKPPRGIAVDGRNGKWLLPVIFGADQESREAAERFAIDHNTLTLSGGGFTSEEIDRIFDPQLLEQLQKPGVDLGGLLILPPRTVIFQAQQKAPGEFPVVDQNLQTDHECPRCGYVWSGSTLASIKVDGEPQARLQARAVISKLLSDAAQGNGPDTQVSAELSRLAEVFSV